MFLLWELCIAFPRSAESMQFCVRRDIQTLLLGGMIGRRRAPAVGAGKNVNAVNKVRVDIDRKGRGEDRDGLDEQGDGSPEQGHQQPLPFAADPPATEASVPSNESSLGKGSTASSNSAHARPPAARPPAARPPAARPPAAGYALQYRHFL
ncbi:hypothetical protein NHJ6243_005683 [Beauveria neobassiana]